MTLEIIASIYIDNKEQYYIKILDILYKYNNIIENKINGLSLNNNNNSFEYEDIKQLEYKIILDLKEVIEPIAKDVVNNDTSVDINNSISTITNNNTDLKSYFTVINDIVKEIREEIDWFEDDIKNEYSNKLNEILDYKINSDIEKDLLKNIKTVGKQLDGVIEKLTEFKFEIFSTKNKYIKVKKIRTLFSSIK